MLDTIPLKTVKTIKNSIDLDQTILDLLEIKKIIFYFIRINIIKNSSTILLFYSLIWCLWRTLKLFYK